ncbi:amidase [Burkholderia plantarii]|uniref:amidase n=1 Tax=Burkholderia plantarii TaxID=41899 RepID=UPI00272A5F25|nr:amidase [Burkholderia plantarii]WLE62566.1 amidase [Burkholderia plantarii]
MIPIDTLPLRELVGLQRRGRLSSRALAEHYLARIAERNPRLNAIIEPAAPRQVLAEADAADAALRRGRLHGPLHGVPLTLKDACHVRGFHPSRGVRELHGKASDANATVVQRMFDAGAVALGLSNVPEMCMAFETDNLLHGRTLNPHHPDRSAGGSSGGEAAAIAAGMSPGGLASDACGSVRVPAHFNGVYGLKPTQWRVPLTGQFPQDRSGLFHLCSSFAVMGRGVDDVALLGELISGPDGHDPDTVPAPFGDYRRQPLAPLRVGVWHESAGPARPSAAVRERLQHAAALLDGAVASVVERAPPMVDEACEVLWKVLILGGDGGRGWRQLFGRIGKQAFSPPIAALLEWSAGLEMSVDELRAALVMRDTVRYQLAAWFREIDVLICPVYPDVAFGHGESLREPATYRYVFPFSLSGSPAVVIPAGRCPDSGLPIGLQLVGRHWDEHQLLAVAAHLERRLPAWEPA